MQNNVICNEIIPQIDSKNVIKAIQKLNIGYFNAKFELAQNMQQLEELTQELAEIAQNAPDKWSIKRKLESAVNNLMVFNKKVRITLKTKAVAFNKKAVNVYKKIVSSCRAVRSRSKVSNPSKSIQGDGGDSGDPDPARPKSFVIPFHHQLPRISKLNRFLFSWLSSKSCCAMDWRRAA